MELNGTQSFSASYDRTTQIISCVVCAILVVAVAVTQSLAVAALGAVVLFISYAYSPTSYRVAGQSIIVNRLIGSVRVDLEGAREMRAGSADDFRGCVRLWGNGGLFGYYGLFRTWKLGRSTWYLTNRSKTVVLITGRKTVVFSPDDVEGFLAATRAIAPAASMAGVSQPGAIEPRGVGFAWIGVAVGVVALAVAVFAFSYAPGPPRVTLTSGALAIHDRFFPVTLKAADVDAAHIRVIDITVDREWQPTRRTKGFSNSHYRSGWFQAANGQQVRLYSAGARRLVLLPPRGDGAAVLLEVRDPEKFVEEVQQAWNGGSKAALGAADQRVAELDTGAALEGMMGVPVSGYTGAEVNDTGFACRAMMARAPLSV